MLCFFSAPTGIRTPVVALKGLRPSPLDDGGKTCGGAKPPISKRADFIIPFYSGQAIGLLLFFRALVEQSHHVYVFAVEEDGGAFHFQVGDEDGGQQTIEDGDEVAGGV